MGFELKIVSNQEDRSVMLVSHLGPFQRAGLMWQGVCPRQLSVQLLLLRSKDSCTRLLCCPVAGSPDIPRKALGRIAGVILSSK